MKYFLRTFGCQMNVHDSERISEILEKRGYRTAEDAGQADCIIINSCSVREKAWHKAISEVGRMCALKKNRPEVVVVAAGCVAEQEGQRWFERLPALDLVVGPDHYARLPELIDRVKIEKSPRAAVGFDTGRDTDFLGTSGAVGGRTPSAFVTVMKGCSEQCAYCIVPSVRGPERFRSAETIVSEAELLLAGGVQEIVLLGQKVNAYEREGVDFADLLERLDALSGLQRLRFTSPHPRHMTRKLIERFATLDSLCEAIHLPAQSGSDRILERMGRRYTAGFYREAAFGLKEACPSLLISTDIIVGFPGETVQDFEATVNLIREVEFAGVFSFKYSPRPGTPAAALPDDVPPEEKARRLDHVHEAIEAAEQRVKARLVGTRQEVLVEGEGRNPGQLSGRARNNQIVNFVPRKNATLDEERGRLVAVDIIRALPHCLEAVPA